MQRATRPVPFHHGCPPASSGHLAGPVASGALEPRRTGVLALPRPVRRERGVVHAVRPPPAPPPMLTQQQIARSCASLRSIRGALQGHASLTWDPWTSHSGKWMSWKRRFGMVWVAELRFAPGEQGFPREAFDRLLRQAVSLGMVVTVNTDMDGVSELARTYSPGDPRVLSARGGRRPAGASAPDRSSRRWEKLLCGSRSAGIRTYGPG